MWRFGVCLHSVKSFVWAPIAAFLLARLVPLPLPAIIIINTNIDESLIYSCVSMVWFLAILLLYKSLLIYIQPKPHMHAENQRFWGNKQ